MTSGDTAADKSVSGYLTNEQITLATSPTGSSYSWGISKPSAATSRSDLNDDDVASVKFTPDAQGYYVITCTVDVSTTYVIRINVAAVGTATDLSILRLSPVTDAQVPTPATGASIYYSSTQGALSAKLTDGSVVTIDTTAT